MTGAELVSVMDVTAFIVGVASVVLSIVAIVFTILFYVLGRNESKEISQKSQDIATQTNILKSLIDTMLQTSLEMIRDNSKAMQQYLLSTVGQTHDASTSTANSHLGQGEQN